MCIRSWLFFSSSSKDLFWSFSFPFLIKYQISTKKYYSNHSETRKRDKKLPVELYFTFHPLCFFLIFIEIMSGNSINIYNACYNVVLPEKLKKKKIAQVRTALREKQSQHGPHSKSSSTFSWKQEQKIISFQELFILSKYQKFWLTYKSFSVLCDILLHLNRTTVLHLPLNLQKGCHFP